MAPKIFKKTMQAEIPAKEYQVFERYVAKSKYAKNAHFVREAVREKMEREPLSNDVGFDDEDKEPPRVPVHVEGAMEQVKKWAEEDPEGFWAEALKIKEDLDNGKGNRPTSWQKTRKKKEKVRA